MNPYLIKFRDFIKQTFTDFLMQRSSPGVKGTKQKSTKASTPNSLKPIKSREITGIVPPNVDSSKGFEVFIDEMRITQSKLIKQIEALNKENKKLKIELETEKSINSELQISQTLNNSDSQIADLKNKLIKTREDLALLTAQNKQLEEEISVYRLSSLKQQSIIDELNNQLSSQEYYDKPQRFPDTKIHLLQERNKKLLSTIISLRKQQQITNTEIATQKSANRELAQQLTDVLTNDDEDTDTIVHIEDMSSYPEVKKLVEMNAKKAKRIESLKSEIRYMRSTISEQSEKEKTLLDFIESSSNENQKKITELSQKVSNYENSQNEINELRKALEITKTQLEEMRTKTEKEMTEKSSMKTELEKTKTENSDLKEKIKEFSDKSNYSINSSFDSNYSMDPIFEQELQQKTKEISQMKVAINQLTSLLEESEHSMNSQICEKENELVKAQKTIKMCQEELESIKSQQTLQDERQNKAKENVNNMMKEISKSFTFASIQMDDEMNSLKDVSKFVCTNYTRSKEQVQSLQKENEDLRSELKQAQLKNKELSFSLSDLQSSSQSKLQNTITQSQKSEERIKEELNKTQNQLSKVQENFKQREIDLEKQVSNSQLTIDQLETEKTNMKTRIDELMDQLSAFHDRQTDFTSSINSLEQTYKNKEKAYSDTISQLNDEKSSLKLKEEQLTNRLNTMESAMIDLRSEIKKLEKKKQKLIIENNELKTALEEFQADNKTVLAEREQKIGNLRNSNSEMEMTIRDLRKEVKEQRQAFEDLKNNSNASINAKIEKINKLRQKLKQLQDAFVELTNEKDNIARENVYLQLKITGQSDTVKRAEEQSQKMTAAKEAGDYVFKSLTKKYQDLQKELADNLQFVEQSKTDVSDMQKIVADKEAERIDALNQMNTIKQKYESLLQEKEEMKKDLSETSKNLEDANQNNTELQLERKQNAEKIKELSETVADLKQKLADLQKQNTEILQTTVPLSVYEKLKLDKDDIQKQFNFVNDELHTTKSIYELEDKEYEDYKEQTSKKISQLNKTVEDLNNELTRVRDENDREAHQDELTIKKLQDQVDSLNKKLSAVENERIKSENEQKELRRKTKESADLIKAKNDELVVSLEKKQKQIEELDQTMKETQEALADALSKNEKTANEKIEVEKKLQEVEATQNEKFDEHTRKLSNAKKAVRDLEQEKLTHERIIMENNLKIEELKAQMRNSVPKEEYNKLLEKIELLKKEKLLESTKLQKTAYVNEVNNEKLKEELAAKEKVFNEKVSQLTQERDKKAEQVKKLVLQVKQLNDKVTELTQNSEKFCPISERDEKVIELKAKNEELNLAETKLKARDQIINSKDREINELNDTIEKLNEQIFTLQNLEDEIQNVENEKLALERDYEAQADDMKALSSTIKSMNEKLLEKTRELENLKNEKQENVPKISQLDQIMKIAKDLHTNICSQQFSKLLALPRLKMLEDALTLIFTNLSLPNVTVMPPSKALVNQQGPSFFIPGDKSLENKEERVLAADIIKEFPELGKQITPEDTLDRQLHLIHTSLKNLKLLLEDRERRIRDMSNIVATQHNVVLEISKDPGASNLLNQSVSNSSAAKEIDSF